MLTGETGAGKTMVTVGLALAIGQRASATLVRSGASAARVQARFDATPAATKAGWDEDDELLLARQVTPDGRSTARIGGQLAPVSALSDLGAGLVEAHGQHHDLRLLSSSEQTAFLDRSAGRAHLALLEQHRDAFGRLRAMRARLEELAAMERDRERELDLLRYQVREIEAAAPHPGERVQLEAQEARLAHAERLLERALTAETALAGDDATTDTVAVAAAALSAAADIDPGAAGLADRARQLSADVTDLAHEARAYRESLVLDPDGLEQVRARIAALRGLERRYGEGEEVLAFLAAARSRLEELTGVDDERERLAGRAGALEREVATLAERLSAERAEAAPPLAAALRAEIRELGMEGGDALIGLVPLDEPGPAGAERAEFLFSGGPAQPLLPLAKVASGGELSRTMLACRSVLVDLDDVPTLVFDEVDAGIGGRAGVAVGRRLARLAERRQVLVVTHLPQIACFADRHIRVTKQRGTASVQILDDPARVAELSRMLSGLPESEAASTHAEELLAEAGRSKPRG